MKAVSKHSMIITGILTAILVSAIILAICSSGKKPAQTGSTEPVSTPMGSRPQDLTSSVETIPFVFPETSGQKHNSTMSPESPTIPEASDSTIIAPPEPPSNDPDNTNEPLTKAESEVKPISPVESDPPKDSESPGDVTIGGGDTPKPYSCGVSGHHCDGPETHAYILNLELRGCEHCGSHSCPSFYATDEWGYTCYTPSKCPKYDIKKDPVYYCEDCGKKCGDGSGGSCVQFVNAAYCPHCGRWVESWTCHTCK